MDATFIIQARMTSTRLPGKVLLPLDGIPLLELQVGRLRRGWPRNIIIATSDEPADDPIEDLCRKMDVLCVRGSRQDVLARYALAARHVTDDMIMRVTADCPLIDPHVVDLAMSMYDGSDFYGWFGLPDGAGFEILPRHVLMRAHEEATLPYEREHVSPYIYTRPDLFHTGSIDAPAHYYRPDYRITVDEPDDVAILTEIAKHVDVRYSSLIDVIRLLDDRPDIRAINSHVMRRHYTHTA